MIIEVLGRGYRVLFPAESHVLWEELHFPRADCPAQSVVERLRVREREREKGGSTTGGTALRGHYWALEETRFLLI